MLATTTWQKLLANVATIALIVGVSAARPSVAAPKSTMIGIVDNVDAIASCSLTIDGPAKMITPLVTMQPPARTTPVDIRFTLFDATGTLVETHDVSVPPPTFGPALAPFSYSAHFTKAHCDLKPVEPTAATTSASPSSGGGGGAGALIVIGALAAVGGIAAVAGSSHGGGSSSSSPTTSQPILTPTPVQVTPTPSPVGINTPTATATPTASSPGSPTATPAVTPSDMVTPTATATAKATATATATASPKPTPTPATGPLILSPAALAFTSTGASQNKTSTATESGYTGTYSAASGACASVATISAPSGGTFTITPTGAGTCSFTVLDTHNKSAQLGIVVTVTSGTIETRRRTETPRTRN